MNSQFLDEASKVIHEPQVLINMVSKRVRQLSAGSRAMVPVEGHGTLPILPWLRSPKANSSRRNVQRPGA